MGTRFQVYFTPLPGFFSPFPRGTSSLSVITEYLVLGGGPPGFERGFTCPVLLGIPVGFAKIFDYGAFTRCGRPFHGVGLILQIPRSGPATPKSKLLGLDLCAFARHYLRNRFLFLFLRVLRCFTSPGVASNGLSLFIH